MTTERKKSYIEEGEFDCNGLLVVGRKIFDDGTQEYVGCNIDKAKWELYLKKFTHDIWKEQINAQKTTMKTMSHDEHILPIANHIIQLQMLADM